VLATLVLGSGAAFAFRTNGSDACSPDGPAVHVSAAPDIAPVVSAAASTFGNRNAGCVSFDVVAQEPASLIASLADGAIRPPDVWVPDSSLWLTRADDDKVTDVPSPTSARSIATSPLVLAVSSAVAERIPHTGTRPEVGDLVAAYQAGAEVPVQISDQRLLPARVGAIVALQAATSERPDSRAALTALLRSAEKPGSASESAVPVPEQSVWAANKAGAPAHRVAIYPGGASYDYPFVVLSQKTYVRKTAGRLLDSLRSTNGQAKVRAAGFRDVSGKADPTLTAARGVDGTLSAPLQPLDDASLQQAERTLESVTMDARLLAVIDVSGSMARAVPEAGPGATRFSLAREAAVRGLSLYPDTTDVGLWVFSQNLNGDTDYREIVPVSPLSGTAGRDRLAQALASASPIPDGNTALYDTALAAVRAVRQGWVPGRVNAVVLLSDGENTDRTGLTLDQLVAALQSENDPARPVPVITIAYGPESDAQSLAQISAATGGAAYTSRDPQQIQQVFLDAVGQRACRPDCAAFPTNSPTS
jgi:Ca-activated chloride channel homolog